MPVAFITAMTMIAQQIGANRVVTGTKLIHPCGDPNISPNADKALRREIINNALIALETDVKSPTVFVPEVSFTSG